MWKPLEFLNEGFIRGSPANLKLTVALLIFVAALAIFGGGR
jgi:hypothetical protein